MLIILSHNLKRKIFEHNDVPCCADKPVVSFSSSSVTAAEGDSLVLSCLIDANPPVAAGDIWWTRRDQDTVLGNHTISLFIEVSLQPSLGFCLATN